MPIEIRELLIKVKIEENAQSLSDNIDLQQMKQAILKECKKEVSKQLKIQKQR